MVFYTTPPFVDPRMQAQDETVDPRPEGLLGPPGPTSPGLPPPPTRKPGLDAVLQGVMPYGASGQLGSAATGLPGLVLAGLGGLIGGKKSGLAQFGLGMLEASNKNALEANQRKAAEQHEMDQNRMANVGARMEKMRRLASDPRYAAVVQAYDAALMDGSFTAKEAQKIQQMADGLPDPEGVLQEQEFKRRTDQQIRLAEANDKLKKGQYVDTPYGKMDADEWARVQATMAGQTAADKRATERLLMSQRFEEGRDQRQTERLAQQAKLFGQGQDFKFRGELDDFIKAESTVDELDSALTRFEAGSWFTNPMEKGMAANELRAKVAGLSTSIGRTLGERGVFTDADRATFKQIINPGLVLTDLAPEEARKRLNDLRDFIAQVKQKKMQSYQQVNPSTVFQGGGGGQPTPTPSPGPGLPPPSTGRFEIISVE